MTEKEALAILKQYNAWRRDEATPSAIEMANTTDIGKAIDVAIRVLRLTPKIEFSTEELLEELRRRGVITQGNVINS